MPLDRAPRYRILLILAVTLLLFQTNGFAQTTSSTVFARYEEALKHFQARNYDSATIILKNILQEEHNNLSARFLLGKVHLARGDGASAQKELLLARTAGADRNLIAEPLARAFLLQGNYHAVFDEVPISVRPKLIKSQLWIVRGETEIKRGNLDAANTSSFRLPKT